MQRSRMTTFLVCLSTLALGGSAFAQVDPTERFRPEPPTKVVVPPTDGVAADATGGPDAFGYTFIDSNEAGGPTFSFVDISASGTAVPLGDDAEVQVPIGFSFNFYGNAFSQVFIVSNGFLSFDGGAGGAFTNDCPFGGSSNNVIAPYWDDLDPGDDGANAFHQTFGSCPNTEGGSGQCTVFQWEEFDLFPGDGTPGGSGGTFQVILYDTGSILMQYQGGPGITGSSATIGISNDAGANSLLYACNTAATVAANQAILWQAPLFGDLEVTKSGEPLVGEPFAYTITATNNGPEDQTGVAVTDNLPAGLTYVGDDCGGDFADGVWTIGNLAAGSSVTCTLGASLDAANCAVVSNTATIAGDLSDPPQNNSATASNGGGNAVGDPGFEGGTPNATWNETSTNFGTPICDVGGCGTGTGTGPFNGNFWAWFGGIGTLEDGTVSQNVTLSSGVTDLTFWVESIICDSAADFLEVTIDGTQVFLYTGSDPDCGVLGYHQETVDISAFADGGVHNLTFHSTIFANNGGGSNFFVDDVNIDSAPSCMGTPFGNGGPIVPIIEVPTLDTVGLSLLVILLLAGAIVQMRRRTRQN